MACNPLHSDQRPADGIHAPISYEYADATARTGASGFDANDLGKFAWQQDDDSVWMLTATTPTWQQLTTGGGSSLTIKSGTLLPVAFSGTPKKASVAFSSAYPSSAYAVTLTTLTNGVRSYSPASENKTTGGFDINLHSNSLSGLVEVGWHTIETGE